MGDMSDKRFQDKAIELLEKILNSVSRTGTGDAQPAATTDQPAPPTSTVEYRNGISKPMAPGFVRIERYDNDTGLTSLAADYRRRFNQQPFGPYFAVSADEVRAAWPDTDPAILANLETDGNLAGGQLNQGREFRTGPLRTLVPGVTRFRNDENNAAARELVFVEYADRMRRDLNQPTGALPFVPGEK